MSTSVDHSLQKDPQIRRQFLASVAKISLGVPLATLLVIDVANKPANAKPPYHAPAHGWRGKTGNALSSSKPSRQSRK